MLCCMVNCSYKWFDVASVVRHWKCLFDHKCFGFMFDHGRNIKVLYIQRHEFPKTACFIKQMSQDTWHLSMDPHNQFLGDVAARHWQRW